jgi:NAD(P)-dependent dehydrogenase (short-subunit alcohol dehydrogenase family)
MLFSPDALRGHTILVTGGGSGLGLAMATRFVQLGATAVICGRTEAKLQAAVSHLQAQASHGGKAAYYVCDVRDYDAVGQLVERIWAEHGPLTGLVNNAAGNFLSASEELSPGGFKVVVDIVLHGSFNCTQQVGKRWIAEGLPGAVLSIVTTYTETGCAFVLPSACAKAGVYALTTSLAYEWGTYGIRLNSIAPGPFPTEGAWSRLVPPGSQAGADFNQQWQQRLPLGRFGNPEELADLATFLLSDAAGYITGECITIDGGERLQGAQFNAIAHWMPRPQLKEAFRAMREATHRKG